MTYTVQKYLGHSRYFMLFMLGASLLTLGSCAMKKKSGRSQRYETLERGKTPGSGRGPLSDASGAGSVAYSKSKMDNYAQLLGVSSREIAKSSQLYSFIDDWMGTPHRSGGLDRKGMDCSAFVGLLYREVYRENLPRTSRDMAETVKRKYENQLREGDLVFFSFGGRNIDHVGIYLHNGKFVHVSTKKGVIISNLKDTWYYRYFKRAGTPKV